MDRTMKKYETRKNDPDLLRWVLKNEDRIKGDDGSEITCAEAVREFEESTGKTCSEYAMRQAVLMLGMKFKLGARKGQSQNPTTLYIGKLERRINELEKAVEKLCSDLGVSRNGTD